MPAKKRVISSVISKKAIEQSDPIYDRPQAAAYIGASITQLEGDVVRPRLRIPYLKIGRNVRYRKSDLDAFLERCRINPLGPDQSATA